MREINWEREVNLRKNQLLEQTVELLQIKSVLNEENELPDAPLGKEVKEALLYMLKLGEKDGFQTKNVGNLAGHIEYGEGDELLGILCHVDVVPAGDGWSSDPYSGEIRDGKIFARGAIDDKGPTMAAYYAMKIVKELQLPLKKRVRMIIGTDEESDWRCVEHYFKEEEMPTIGFAPDADFPIIYAEKGIADFDIEQEYIKHPQGEKSCNEVISFTAGQRKNMVPDFARCTLKVGTDGEKYVENFQVFMKDHALKNNYYLEEGHLILQVTGVSAHGMEPNKGVNAGLFLAAFIASIAIDAGASTFFQFVTTYFQGDSRGVKLGISYSDEMTGELTLNAGEISYDNRTGGRLGISMRYPVTLDIEKTTTKLKSLFKKEQMKATCVSHAKPHHVAKDSLLIETLTRVYEEQTGERATLLSIGGGTYARSLTSGVAFGPLFPGRQDTAHQKDEHMYVEDLLKATAIYAQAIYELAR